METCSTVEEFIALVDSIPKWSHSGENVDVVDAKGSMARISFSTNRTFINRTLNHFIGSANHYHDREMQHFGPSSAEDYPSSYARYGRLIDLLWENYGKIDREVAMKIMGDHKYGDTPPDGDLSICRHGKNRQTMVNLISLPSQGEFWISEGNPCRREYTKFNL
jgi:hypothetical protein